MHDELCKNYNMLCYLLVSGHAHVEQANCVGYQSVVITW